jgi:hypothetical protein
VSSLSLSSLLLSPTHFLRQPELRELLLTKEIAFLQATRLHTLIQSSLRDKTLLSELDYEDEVPEPAHQRDMI